MSTAAAAPPALPAPPVPAPPPAVSRLPFGLFLALRYLKPRRTFVSVITLICILGVALGVAMPIIVISVMSGYDREIKKAALGFDPHIEIMTPHLIDHWRELRAEIKDTPGVVASSPFVMGPILAEAHNRRLAPQIRGIEPDLEAKVIDLNGLMGKGSEGKFDLDGDKAVVGVDLARALDLQLHDKLTLYSPRNLEALAQELKNMEGKKADPEKIDQLRSLVAPVEVEVTGFFYSGRYPYDSGFLFVPLHLGQELYELEGRVHGVSVRTADPYRAGEVAKALNAKFDRDADARPAAETDDDPRDNVPHAQTWMELNAAFYGAVRTERATMFVILFVVLIVAAFCVMNTMITVTVQKKREIGIMKAVGADVWQIVRVFTSQGVAVGVIGILAGLGIGLAFLHVLNPFKRAMERFFNVEVFDRHVYGLADIPYWTKPADVTVICVSMFAICSLAALIPAYLAARLDPVKALRAE